MSPDDDADLNAEGLQQGDWLTLKQPLSLPSLPDGGVTDVVLISQTCDIVQRTRDCVTVAPVQQASEALHLEVLRGKRPLVLPFPSDGDRPVVLLEHATSVRKDRLLSATRTRRIAEDASSFEARDFARRIGSAYSRFPVPDEAVPALAKLTDLIRKEAPKSRALGQALREVLEIRIESRNGWFGPTFKLRLFLVMKATCLVASDLLDGMEDGGDDDSSGKHSPGLDTLVLREVCELLTSTDDDVVRAHACDRLAECLEKLVILDGVVTSCSVEAVSEDDFTYRQFRVTESLSFEAMSVVEEPG